MGYKMTEILEEADIIIYNTCAIREHAEDRVFGNVGALKTLKKNNKNLVIGLCGCMMQQEHVAEKIKNSYPYVNLVFGTRALHKLPELLFRVFKTKKRVFSVEECDGVIAEGMPNERDSGENAWLPIMYGCDNYCSYCVVPYVRGRERSREADVVLKEAEDLINEGYKKITLLGQNVNSYGKSLENGINFAELIRRLDKIEGDYTFDFMTSHPKDCTKELIDVLASSKHFCGHLHLPVQSGNNRILKEMNRKYTREHYLDLVNYAKEKIPNVDITTDIIVGFPGETYEEFLDTVSLVKEVKYGSMFTFIYSKRKGTKAATFPDPVSKEEKTKWFMELLKVQEEIAKCDN
jgi:tRNA-2-methylthio-N6-dimethylallyladenosine synthase